MPFAALAASAFLNIMFLASLGYTPEHAQPAATASLYFSVPLRCAVRRLFRFLAGSGGDSRLAEILGRRDWLFYALAGAVVAAVFLGFVHQTADANFEITDPRVSLP